MKIKFIPLFLYAFSMLAFASCRQEDGSSVRNVRFDPKLLNQAVDGTSCASYSYSSRGEQTNLGSVYTKQVLVVFNEGSTYNEQKAVAEKYSFIKGLGEQTNTNSAMLYTVELEDGLNCKQTEQAISLLEDDELITYVAPYFVKGNNLAGLSNEAIITIKDGGRAALNQLLEAYNVSVVSSLNDAVYVVKVDKNSNGNALELVNYLRDQESIAHAEPGFVKPLAPAHLGLNRGTNGTSKIKLVH